MNKLLLLIITSTLCIGCSNLNKSLIVGATVGASGGALVGNAHGKGSKRDKATTRGSIIGGVIGTVIGYLGFKDKKKKEAQQKAASGSSKKSGLSGVPLLTQPKVKRVWVDDRVSGKRYIKGHWEYIIEEQSVWSKK